MLLEINPLPPIAGMTRIALVTVMNTIHLDIVPAEGGITVRMPVILPTQKQESVVDIDIGIAESMKTLPGTGDTDPTATTNRVLAKESVSTSLLILKIKRKAKGLLRGMGRRKVVRGILYPNNCTARWR